MSADTRRLRELLAEATPGPWEAEGSQVWGPDGVLVAATREHSTLVDRPDALIVAAAVNALPELLDALRAVAELHDGEWSCGNPRHSNPGSGCPECEVVCKTCGDRYPCTTIQALRVADEDADR